MDPSAEILVTRRIPAGPFKRLRDAGFSVTMASSVPDAPLTREEFIEAIRGRQAVVSMLTDRWDEEAFRAAGSRLKIIANYAVGFNNVDLEAAARHGVLVSNTPDVLTDATADIAWGLLMMAARGLGSAERETRAGRFTGWGPSDYLGVDLRKKRLGIVGAGRIGTAMARRSIGWEMEVLYSHPRCNEALEALTGARRFTLEQLLRRSDFVSIHVPLTKETHHLIGMHELSIMKPTSVLINTARGPIVDERALVEALSERWIFAAGLDVYENEPAIEPGLLAQENVVLLPHLGSATGEARTAMAKLAADNIFAALTGEEPPNLVRRKVAAA